ncbi:calmodulin [Angomonas deanei]|nr:calmodulin [Angomonas deanei]|eukprot:EPY29443.1 calmodulin [Angomonas deanei]
MPSFSTNEVAEFREIFTLVAGNRDYITMPDLRKLLSTLQVRIDESDLEELFFEDTTTTRANTAVNNSSNINSSSLFNSDIVSKDGGQTRIHFNTFLNVMTKRLHAEFSKDELKKAFETFDDIPGGFISTDMLRHVLMTYGTEKLTAEEAQKIIGVVDPQNTGCFKYTEFIEKVMDQY